MAVTVRLRNPDRMLEAEGPATVLGLLRRLDVLPETVLVIREGTILTRDETVRDGDVIELRPVVSGGAP